MKVRKYRSVAGDIRQRVGTASVGTFFGRADFAGSEAAIDTALSRLTATQELLRVRKGLYWKGATTRFGMTRPAVLEVALAIAGPGSGPASIAAAYALGLTTQVPAVVEVAVPGKVPDPYPGVRFRSRAYERRLRELRPMEVAVLELLRDPVVAEADWTLITRRINELIGSAAVRADILMAEAADEAHPAVRARIAEIVAYA